MQNQRNDKKDKRILLIGTLPPIYTGQSVSFKMLTDNIKNRAKIRIVNLSGRRVGSNSGEPSTARALDYLSIFFDFFVKIIRPTDTVYITIAQSTHGFFRDFVFICTSSILGRNVVVHLKGGNYGTFYAKQNNVLKAVIRWTLRKTDRILVLGEKLRPMYDFEPSLENKIYVVENGLPFEPSHVVKEKRIIENEPINLLFLSNLIESKGYLDLIEALRILREKHGFRDFKCHFAGEFMLNDDDSQIASLEQAKDTFFAKIGSHSLQGSVVYHGTVNGVTKEKLLMLAHVFVLPTNYNNEGQPVSIIEALAYATPIIATDYRAISDMLIDGETGFFVKYGDPEDLAFSIKRTIENDENFSKISRNARALYESKFTTEKHLSRIYPHILSL
jgi:glycosyltransferase involved in cell wall biosynthesis